MVGFGNKQKSRITKSPLVPLETEEQINFIKWLDLRGILFYHVPNGFRRSPGEARKLRLLGVRAGVPDICIPVPIAPYHGLYIEMKRQSGSVSSYEQRAWRDTLRRNGYICEFVKGFDKAVELTNNYLGGLISEK